MALSLLLSATVIMYAVEGGLGSESEIFVRLVASTMPAGFVYP